MGEVKKLEELVAIVNNLKKIGRKIATTNGCFDILHVGHVRYLKEAKGYGDILIVGINSDSSVKILKGKGRPILPESERVEIVAALECVDYVFIFQEKDPINFIKKLKPHFHVKGGDYKIEEILERKAVEEGGGKVILTGKIESPSTTDVVKTIIEKYSDKSSSK